MMLGYENEEIDYNLSDWSVTSVTSTAIDLLLDFTSPLEVS